MYRWVLWLHIVAVISWMAGILYLYRLFIYHSERGRTNRDIHDLLTVMERRLYVYITRPALFVASAAGITMILLNRALLAGGWLQVKLTLAVRLIASTFYAGKLCRVFADQSALVPRSKTLRFLNEVPTLLMLFIVGMVIFRPF